jgi:hypothetical protein
MKNMKKLFWIILFLPSLLFAQQTAEFETTIYVMDLNGNMDSVIIGYDINATSFFGLDSQFGEIDISTNLWDSVFEVRTSSDFGNPETYQSKKIINEDNCNSLFTPGGGGVVLSIRTHTPIVITWNMQDFQDNCIDSSVVVEDDVFFQYPFFNYYQESYMAKRSNHGSTFDLFGYNYSYYQGNIEGGQTDTIYNVFIALIDDMNDLVNIREKKYLQQQTNVFPNPTTEAFTIALPENYYNESIKVFDITGRTIYESTEKSNQINVPSADWAKGIYFYQVRLEDGIVTSGKVLKE